MIFKKMYNLTALITKHKTLSVTNLIIACPEDLAAGIEGQAQHPPSHLAVTTARVDPSRYI